MKNCSKTIKKALSCVLGLGLCALAVLAPFTGLKKASAEQGFPPSFNPTGNSTEYVSLYPLNAFTVSAIGGNVDNDEYVVDFTQQYALSPFVDSSTVHEKIFSLGEYGQVDLRATADEFNYRLFTTLAYLDSPSAFYGVEFTLNFPFYLNESLYEYFFSSSTAPFGVYFSLSGEYGGTYSVTADYDFTFGKYQNGYYATTHITGQDTLPNSNVYRTTDYFPTWEQLDENGVIYEGFAYLNDFSFRCFCRLEYYSAHYIGVNVQKKTTFANAGLLLSNFKNSQTAGQFAHRDYIKVPVDDVGLNTIGTAVSNFLNIEFIPDFKLWYFLLIGLGCAVTGIALKFFLGG